MTISPTASSSKSKSFSVTITGVGKGTATVKIQYSSDRNKYTDHTIVTVTVNGQEIEVTEDALKGDGLRISEICPDDNIKDPHGVDSGFIELVNAGTTNVNLANYSLARVNRGKALKASGFWRLPDREVTPGERVTLWANEGYVAGDNLVFAAPLMEADVVTNVTRGGKSALVFPAKINPKKYPLVVLKRGTDETIDAVTIPSDVPSGWSVVLMDPETGDLKGASRRCLTSNPTQGEQNLLVDPIAVGPEVGPLYGTKHGLSDTDAMPPAKAGEDYAVTLDVNAPYGSTNALDEIVGVKLVYRTDLSATSNLVAMATNEWAEGHGWRWAAKIPAAKLPAAGHLIQWRAQITDAAGNTWTSPSFNNPEDGYAWYGTIVEPTADQMSQNGLDTFHIFAASGVADTPGANNTTCAMNIDYETLMASYAATYPYGARVAIYDSSTSNYYDNVRIDLRGNTTGDSIKRSHGLKFGKSHPLKLARPITTKVNGKEIVVEEVRKTSFIAEFADPSYVRQQLAFWLFNQCGAPAPFDYPVRLNLNGAFYQLAFHSERFSDELIEDVYGMDKLGYAFKNVGQFTCTSGTTTGTTAGGIEKKTPDDNNEDDVSKVHAIATALKNAGVANVAQSDDGSSTAGLNNADLTKLVVTNFDLAAWINYLAIARITHETDDAWANLSAYCDQGELIDGSVRGTGTWRPLAYDMNLSFGQWYYNDAAALFGHVYMVNQDNFKSHPFYGGLRIFAQKNASTYFTARGNWAMEAVWQNKKFRRLYVRRLRTLMDAYLKAPGTAKADSPLWVRMQELVTSMGGSDVDGDAVRDRTLWGPLATSGAAGAPEINIWGDSTAQPANAQAGIEEIWEKYIVNRRTHLYETHTKSNAGNATGYGANVSAGIPDEQSAVAALKSGISASYDATIGAVIIRNANAETIDVSGWKVSGPVAMTLPGGTVLDGVQSGAVGEVYVTADRRATVAQMTVSDQVVVGNGTAGEATAPIGLMAADGTVVISVENEFLPTGNGENWDADANWSCGYFPNAAGEVAVIGVPEAVKKGKGWRNIKIDAQSVTAGCVRVTNGGWTNRLCTGTSGDFVLCGKDGTEASFVVTDEENAGLSMIDLDTPNALALGSDGAFVVSNRVGDVNYGGLLIKGVIEGNGFNLQKLGPGRLTLAATNGTAIGKLQCEEGIVAVEVPLNVESVTKTGTLWVKAGASQLELAPQSAVVSADAVKPNVCLFVPTNGVTAFWYGGVVAGTLKPASVSVYVPDAAGAIHFAGQTWSVCGDATARKATLADGRLTYEIQVPVPPLFGGEEPGEGVVAEGGVSKFDGTAVYDGTAVTLATNELFAALGESSVAGLDVLFALGELDVAPTEGWTNEVPVFADAGVYVVWYKVSARGYEDFVHAAEVTVAPREGVVVNVTGYCATNVYSGAEMKVMGYETSANDALYDVKDVAFSGTASARGTDVGIYKMGLAAAQFTNTNPNFTNVTFEVSDGELVITKATYDLGGVTWDYSGAFTFDGTVKTVSLQNLPDGLHVEYVDNAQRDAGDYTARAVFIENGNHVTPSEMTFSWSISKARLATAKKEPGGGTIPSGGFSAFDWSGAEDGKAHTIQTNALLTALSATVVGDYQVCFAIGKVSTYGTLEYAELPSDAVWTETAPVFTNVGRYAVYYKVTSTNYRDYSHAALVAIAERTNVATSEDGTTEYATVEEAVSAGRTDNAIVFAEAPTIDNANHTITPPGGTAITVPDYYDIALEGTTVTFTLNSAAQPQITGGVQQTDDGETEIPAFDVAVGTEGDQVGVGTTTRKGLFYALQVGSDIQNLSVPNGANWTEGTGGVLQLKADKPNGVSCGFFRIVVSDSIQ